MKRVGLGNAHHACAGGVLAPIYEMTSAWSPPMYVNEWSRVEPRWSHADTPPYDGLFLTNGKTLRPAWRSFTKRGADGVRGMLSHIMISVRSRRTYTLPPLAREGR